MCPGRPGPSHAVPRTRPATRCAGQRSARPRRACGGVARRSRRGPRGGRPRRRMAVEQRMSRSFPESTPRPDAALAGIDRGDLRRLIHSEERRLEGTTAASRAMYGRARDVLVGGVASSYQLGTLAALHDSWEGRGAVGPRRDEACRLPQRIRSDGAGPRTPRHRPRAAGALWPRNAFRGADRGCGHRRRGAGAPLGRCPSGATPTRGPSRPWTPSGSRAASRVERSS